MRAKYIYYNPVTAAIIGFAPLETAPTILNNAPGTGIAISPPGPV
jgi:hypothetical protein